MSPTSETDFFPQSVRAEITFVRDEQGRVTHLAMKQGGRQHKAKKIKWLLAMLRNLALGETFLATVAGVRTVTGSEKACRHALAGTPSRFPNTFAYAS